jgi:ubiquinone/menaquinone biosynthesis C-methylase UbiE
MDQVQTRKKNEKKFWDRIAGMYDVMMKAHYRRITPGIVNRIGESDRVLEVAAGTGLITYEVARIAREAIGIDISEEMVKEAEGKKKNTNLDNISFRVEDAYNLTFDDNSFDLVIACNVMHIVQNPDAILQEIRRVLRKNGRVITVTYCYKEKTTFIARFFLLLMISMHKLGLIPYLHQFTIGNFEGLMVNTGFQVMTSEAIENENPLCLLIEAIKV